MLVKGELTRDTGTFAKMDPFVSFRSKEKTFESNVIKRGGLTPSWA